MQPGLMIERVIADFMSGCGDRRESLKVFFAGGVLADDKDRHPQVAFLQDLQESRDNSVKVRGIFVPADVAVSFHVRPFVVEVERQAGDGFW